MRSTFN